MSLILGLCMIVKNEAHVIRECLETVRNLIDTYVICDTGSTDNTAEVIQDCLKGTPGEILHHDWVDFGTNRSQSLKACDGSTQPTTNSTILL